MNQEAYICSVLIHNVVQISPPTTSNIYNDETFFLKAASEASVAFCGCWANREIQKMYEESCNTVWTFTIPNLVKYNAVGSVYY